MSQYIAALPMYDWPENRAEIDAEWTRLRRALRSAGIDPPERLVRRNADMPFGQGVRSGATGVDPASLAPDELDYRALWLHPRLLLAQTCWGPMEQGLARQVQVVGQPSYDAYEGGQSEFYSSAIVMRRDDTGQADATAPADGRAVIPVEKQRNKRFAFNSCDSMSGIIAITRDLATIGRNLGLFAERLETGGHRQSIIAVAEGRADVCAIDCRSWALAKRYEPASAKVQAVGWTARRKGLPYITAAGTSPDIVARLRAALASADQPAISLASSG